MQSHVYFDLDGTLTDPFEGISKCILYALDQLGFEHPPDDFLRSSIGPPLHDTFVEFVGKNLAHQAIDFYRARFDEIGWRENVPYEGIHDALDAVAATGCTMFVATSKPRVAATRIIKYFELERFFAKVYGSELDGTRSNKIDLLRFALTENPMAASLTMIGDRKHDLLGAVANGMTPVGVSYGYGSVEELTNAGAVSVAATPADLPALLS